MRCLLLQNVVCALRDFTHKGRERCLRCSACKTCDPAAGRMDAGVEGECAFCGIAGDCSRCSACKAASYCCVEHQRLHRPQHKLLCRRAAAQLASGAGMTDAETDIAGHFMHWAQHIQQNVANEADAHLVSSLPLTSAHVSLTTFATPPHMPAAEAASAPAAAADTSTSSRAMPSAAPTPAVGAAHSDADAPSPAIKHDAASAAASVSDVAFDAHAAHQDTSAAGRVASAKPVPETQADGTQEGNKSMQDDGGSADADGAAERFIAPQECALCKKPGASPVLNCPSVPAAMSFCERLLRDSRAVIRAVASSVTAHGASFGTQMPAHAGKFLTCQACRAVRYCTAKHQKKHWPAHRAACKLLAAGRIAPPATFADLPAEVLVKIFEHLFPSEYPAAITTRMYPPQLYDPYDAMYRAPAPLLSGAAQAKVYGATGTLPENVVHNTHPVLSNFQPFQLNRATQDLLNAGAACKRWHSVVRDNGVVKHVALAPGLKATTQALALERGNWRVPQLSLPRGVQTLLLSGWAQTIVQLPERGAGLLRPCLYDFVWLPLCG